MVYEHNICLLDYGREYQTALSLQQQQQQQRLCFEGKIEGKIYILCMHFYAPSDKNRTVSNKR